MQRFNRTIRGDKVIWAVVVILSLVSVLAVYSSTGSLAYRMRQGHTEYYLFRQFAALSLGLAIIYIAHRINYVVYSRLSVILFLIAIPLLVITLFYGATINEASRWIKLPVINLTFQTSDMAKLALFLFISRQLARKQKVIGNRKEVYLSIFLPIILICALIMPANLSTAVLLGASCLLLCFIGRVRIVHLLSFVGLGVVVAALVVGFVLITGVGGGRVTTWKHRIENFTQKSDAKEVPYQVEQSKIAIANGQTFGRGPGNSKQKNFLPHPYSDFIYATIIEEYGFVGGVVLIICYLVFLLRSIRIFKKSPYAFGAFLCVGLSFTLVIQAFANMAVAVNLVPVTGVTLPLISMGGTSIWFTSLAIGIILSVSRSIENREKKVLPENDELTEGKEDAGADIEPENNEGLDVIVQPG